VLELSPVAVGNRSAHLLALAALGSRSSAAIRRQEDDAESMSLLYARPYDKPSETDHRDGIRAWLMLVKVHGWPGGSLTAWLALLALAPIPQEKAPSKQQGGPLLF
jgi:hypothetical protein